MVEETCKQHNERELSKHAGELDEWRLTSNPAASSRECSASTACHKTGIVREAKAELHCNKQDGRTCAGSGAARQPAQSRKIVVEVEAQLQYPVQQDTDDTADQL